MIFLGSAFVLHFLPPRKLLNLLSEATPKASIEDNNSPPPSHSADGSASLENFLGTGPRSGNRSPLVHLETPPATHSRVDTEPQPGSSPSRWHWHCPCEHRPWQRFCWSLQTCSQWAHGMWPRCFFRRVCPCGCQHGHASWQDNQRMDGSLLWSLIQAQPRKALAGSWGAALWFLLTDHLLIAKSFEWWCRNCSVKREWRRLLDFTVTAAFERRVICLIDNLSSSIRAEKVRSCWKLSTHMVTWLHH